MSFLFKKTNEIKSAEEYRQEAARHSEKVKGLWRSLFRSLFLTVAALVAIIVASTAWFAANSRTNAGGMGVRVQLPKTFELASVGELEGVYYTITELNNLTVSPNIMINGNHARKTEETAAKIKWMMSPDSNFSNLNLNSKLQPGASGRLEFYIVPPEGTANATVNLKLTMTPYETINGQQVELSEDDDPAHEGHEHDGLVAKLVKGHILFFMEKTDDVYSNWIENGLFSVTCETGDPKLVTIYWCWPEKDTNLIAISELSDSIAQNPEYYYYPVGEQDSAVAYDGADTEIGRTVSHISLSVSIED